MITKWRLLKITLQAMFLHVQKTSIHISSGLVIHRWRLLKITLQAPFLNVQKTFDRSRSSLGLHGNDVCSHQFTSVQAS
ncbi:hypothetical protein Tco_0518574, partial [Tanacetum coccineum]